MRRIGFAVRVAAAGVLLAGMVGMSAAAATAASTPPPSASSLLLRATDLGGRAKTVEQRRDSTSATVQFGPGLRIGSVRLLTARFGVSVASDSDTAHEAFALVVRRFSRAAFRKSFVTETARAVSSELQTKQRHVAAGPLLASGTDQKHFVGSFTVDGSSVRLGVAILRVDRALELVFVVGLVDGPLGARDVQRVVALARERIRAGFALEVTEPPSVKGVPFVGQKLWADVGRWTGGPADFSYVWSRCDATGAACVDIPGATGSSYAVDSTDEGSTLRVKVSGRNEVSEASALSEHSDVVTS